MRITHPVRGLFSKVRLRAGTVVLAAAAVLVPGVVATPSAQAQIYTKLHIFTSAPDGQNPYGGLIRDLAGNLYGTTTFGGAYTFGTVFKVDATGNETVLYSFRGADGAYPRSTLIRDSAGNLYGTASGGGVLRQGTVFKVDTTGRETVLYSFAGGTDGAVPYGGLIGDAAGNLYGTTYYGGGHNYGTVFRLDTTGTETVLHRFAGGADGGTPMASLVRDAAGNLYGTTSVPRSWMPPTVFKVDPTGAETVLYNFTGGADGAYPYSPLIRDAAGKLYGTTHVGGAYGFGVVFKVDATGAETVLYSFRGGTDGRFPEAGLVRDLLGNLYGTTNRGGAFDNGVVFKLDTTGRETVLRTLAESDGANPVSGLVIDLTGNLYGTTFAGGLYRRGVVFKLKP